MARTVRVAVLGCGYVGLPVALLAVAAGHEVIAFDTDPDRIDRLAAGDSYISDIAASEVRAALASNRLHPTHASDALGGFDIALITVPTPLRDAHPDLSLVQAAAAMIAPHVRPGCAVVLESSTYPGTTEEIVAPILESHGLRVGHDFFLGYSPERINPGVGLAGLRAVPKIVAGVDAAATEVIAEFWCGLVHKVVLAPNVRTAELSKLLENAFRLVNVSLVNELARYAGAMGASVWDALDLAATKPFGFTRFTPSPGAGGHCLPVDTRYLAWRVRDVSGRAAALMETALRINDTQPVYVAQRIAKGLLRRGGAPIEAAHIVVVGITYKAGVPDLRESSALKVISELTGKGARVVAVDPVARDVPMVRPQVTRELAGTADAVVVLVAHDGLDLDAIASARYVFDACGLMPTRADNIERL